MNKHFDYIIVGSGCAGLSLAFNIAKSSFLSQKSVLILDADRKTINDRTWCFWSKKELSYESSKKTFWENIEFKADDLIIQDRLNQSKYYHVNSLEFYNEVLFELSTSKNFQIVNESVVQISQEHNKVTVQTEGNIYTADYAFNSVIALLRDKSPKPGLNQHFYGKKVRAKAPFFKNMSVKLMDFSLPNKSAVQFGYVLPFSDYEALIEYTEFSGIHRSNAEYESLFQDYINNLGLSEFEVLETEKGKIPMTRHQFPRFNSSRVLNMGTAGGFTKPTSGYTFNNIQRDVASIVASLESGTPFNRKLNPSRFRFYDKLLLGIILKYPEKVKPIMKKLFQNNSLEIVLKFLDEKTSLKDEIRIFLKLPWAPFLNQIFRK
ncbi:MAG: lycopene beta-cyclase [Roseivirga sp.]|jgi:lycopene beta-cyclase